MIFYLGTHQPAWLGRYDFPMMLSHRRLRDFKRLPRALAPWILDSGAFSELNLHGRFQMGEAEYVEALARYQAEIGNLLWAAPMDWMCEPFVLAKTGKTVEQHQGFTTGNYCRLKEYDAKVIPVLQGWTVADYLRHVQMYRAYGVDLEKCDVVGIGSVCRRQGTEEIRDLLSQLKAADLKIHAFGLKKNGLAACSSIVSSDSMAWSYEARRKPPLPECTTHINCANCAKYAMKWRDELERSLRSRQMLEAWETGKETGNWGEFNTA